MKQYPKYKDSKIPWIGDVPAHWEISRLKVMLENPLQYGANSSGAEYDETLPRYIRITDITKDNRLTSTDMRSLLQHEAKEYILDDKDILFARSGATAGKAFLYKSEYGVAAFAGYLIRAKIKQNIMMAEFVYYSTLSWGYEQWRSSIFIQATIPNIGANKYNNYVLVTPPYSEQQAIVDFLDKAVEKIERYIAAKEAEIEKLGTLKQSIISQAVTKGLDPNAPMKDSGIPWIGDVPEHWEAKRLAIAFSENKRKNSEYTFQKALKFNYGSLVAKNESGDISDLKSTYVDYTILSPKDIVINCLNLNYDFVSLRVAQAQTAGIITSAYLSITPRKEVNSDFYTYFFKAMDSQKLFHGMGTGIRLTLSYSELKKQNIVVPPADEQQAIVQYIDEQVQKIDTSIDNIRQQIEKLKTYKQRLISDTVTGKIDVRGTN